jgi:oligoendopeptidase F
MQSSTNWNLENVFPGGPGGEAFAAAHQDLSTEASHLITLADALDADGQGAPWAQVLPALIALEDRAHELSSFAGCHSAADTQSADARAASAKVSALWTRISRAWSRPEHVIARCEEAKFAALRAQPALANIVPLLDDLRTQGPVLLPEGEQALFTELSESALSAWHRRYQNVSGKLRIEIDGEILSQGQAANRLASHDGSTRAVAFTAMATAWAGVADECAEALSSVVHSHIVRHDRLGVDELALPLTRGRIGRGTLDALMETCRQGRPLVRRYLEAKARHLGHNKLDWWDLRAPVGDAEGSRFDWEEAQDFIVSQFATFSPDMSRFAQTAFAERWVEAEDRAGKRHGAFCAGFPMSQQSRIFMTYGGSLDSLLTLAHELGHAYHNHVMHDLPRARRRLTSNLAETASTFAEAVVRGAAMDAVSTPEAELALLDQELGDATTFLVNIPVRYTFERRLHTLRREGPLTVPDLSAEMERIQREAYGEILGAADPLFWASKLHFYIASNPFYNFPYTFGYLFSGLVHATAMVEGQGWAPAYAALLADTGAGPAEVVAATHLGADLTDAATWKPALNRIEGLVERFEGLTSAKS